MSFRLLAVLAKTCKPWRTAGKDRGTGGIMEHAGPPPLRWGYMVLAVADMAAMTEWYGRVLGLAVTQSGAMPAVESEFAVLAGHGMRLELCCRPAAAATPEVTPPPPHHADRTGWKVLTLHCDDLAALDRHLDAAGAEVLWPSRTLAPGICSTLLCDPEGNLINIFGPPPPG